MEGEGEGKGVGGGVPCIHYLRLRISLPHAAHTKQFQALTFQWSGVVHMEFLWEKEGEGKTVFLMQGVRYRKCGKRNRSK